MKILTLVRHAKSSWDDVNKSDHDRPLLPVGIERTIKVVKYLESEGFKTDLIISSTAVRAHETAKIIASVLKYKVDSIVLRRSIYDGYEKDIYSEIFSLDNVIESVLIVGHNPTFTDFVNEYLPEVIYNLPTSGAVSIRFETNKWEEIINSDYLVNFKIFPKYL